MTDPDMVRTSSLLNRYNRVGNTIEVQCLVGQYVQSTRTRRASVRCSEVAGDDTYGVWAETLTCIGKQHIYVNV